MSKEVSGIVPKPAAPNSCALDNEEATKDAACNDNSVKVTGSPKAKVPDIKVKGKNHNDEKITEKPRKLWSDDISTKPKIGFKLPLKLSFGEARTWEKGQTMSFDSKGSRQKRTSSATELMNISGNASLSNLSAGRMQEKRASSKTAWAAPLRKKSNNRPKAFTETKQVLLQKLEDEMDWDSLVNLEESYECGMIPKKEYERQKQLILENLTGTKIGKHQEERMKWIMNKRSTVEKRKIGEKSLQSAVPDWKTLDEVMAIRHMWNAETMNWTQSLRRVKIAPHPFEHGSLRSCYYMLELTEGSKRDTILGTEEPTHVCKISLDPYEDRLTYFNDAAMQAEAQKFADLYNKMKLPKKVGFLDVWVYQIREGHWSPHRFFDGFCNVEKYIKGEYVKYTTNWDQQALVSKKKLKGKRKTITHMCRNTPPTFSHFTYKISGRKLVVVDIQGVNDLYTDPQMHTLDQKGFGKGNLGKKGIEKFLKTHICNVLCQHLRLDDVRKERRAEDYFQGVTHPNTRYTCEDLPTYDPSTQATNVPDEIFPFPPLIKNREEDIKESNFCNFGTCPLL